ncbi:carboxylic ester hydrolase [Favolaschia claudopus]|uniref:Carboxylic ester hydrolase n=1 Tax=Favolaschia claudopus TaxID=2862362 RepID=A0AAW0DBW5_9AGAR
MASPSLSRSILYATLISTICVQAVNSQSPKPPVVDLGYAQYQGVVNDALNITAFRGIRYAAPPTGPLRWRAPTPPSKVPGIQQASDNPPLCLQGAEGVAATDPFNTRDVAESEDCLFLSVYSPNIDNNTLLPTIVWIHGGGYALGGAGFYNGSELVQESNNQVVVVILQYRLGLFGFLAGNEIKKAGDLNAGLLDQEFALRWVNKNIHNFGGDPEKVTIWGQSAGAGSVIQHVVARNGKTTPKLFRAAMTSSTFLPSQYKYNAKVPQSLFSEVASQAGCNNSQPLECLRKVDSAKLSQINVNIILAGFAGTFTFYPVVDGSFIMQSPTDTISQGTLNTDILLSVTNGNEGALFINQTAEYDVAQYVRNLFPLLGSKDSAAAASLYKSLGSSVDQVNAILGESIFVCPTYRLLDALPGKSYKGEYGIPPAWHGQDAVNYFPTFVEFGGTLLFNNTDFIDAFNLGFLSFAVNLNPNDKLRPSIAPVWPTWSSEKTEMVFNKTALDTPHIASVRTSSALLRRCEFWKDLRHITGQ